MRDWSGLLPVLWLALQIAIKRHFLHPHLACSRRRRRQQPQPRRNQQPRRREHRSLLWLARRPPHHRRRRLCNDRGRQSLTHQVMHHPGRRHLTWAQMGAFRSSSWVSLRLRQCF